MHYTDVFLMTVDLEKDFDNAGIQLSRHCGNLNTADAVLVGPYCHIFLDKPRVLEHLGLVVQTQAHPHPSHRQALPPFQMHAK